MNDPCAVGACVACEGRCCTVYIVPLNGYDVWRIVRAQHLAPSLFVQREPEDRASDISFTLRPAGATFALSLQHIPARRNERPCVFLMQLRDGVQRCGIYADRPLACQSYPMHIQHGSVVPREDMLCPRGSWAGLDQDQNGWRARLLRQEDEWTLYAHVVQAWNAGVRAMPSQAGYVVDEYLDFVVNTYDQIDRMRQAAEPPTTAQFDAMFEAQVETFLHGA